MCPSSQVPPPFIMLVWVCHSVESYFRLESNLFDQFDPSLWLMTESDLNAYMSSSGKLDVHSCYSRFQIDGALSEKKLGCRVEWRMRITSLMFFLIFFAFQNISQKKR